MDPIRIKEAIVEAGGVSALANRLAVTRTTVYRWLKAGLMPEAYQYMYFATRKRLKRG
jgi:predicted site-specific integrase-resolvase